DRRRADRRAVHCRPKRLASVGQDGGADLSAASRPGFPAGARRWRPLRARRCQDLCRAGTRRGSRRIRRGIDRVMSKLVIAAIGPASSVQDGGRWGAQRFGLTPSGAMDRLALAAANTLAGNELFAAGVEIGPYGAVVAADEGADR